MSPIQEIISDTFTATHFEKWCKQYIPLRRLEEERERMLAFLDEQDAESKQLWFSRGWPALWIHVVL